MSDVQVQVFAFKPNYALVVFRTADTKEPIAWMAQESTNEAVPICANQSYGGLVWNGKSGHHASVTYQGAPSMSVVSQQPTSQLPNNGMFSTCVSPTIGGNGGGDSSGIQNKTLFYTSLFLFGAAALVATCRK